LIKAYEIGYCTFNSLNKKKREIIALLLRGKSDAAKKKEAQKEAPHE